MTDFGELRYIVYRFLPPKSKSLLGDFREKGRFAMRRLFTTKKSPDMAGLKDFDSRLVRADYFPISPPKGRDGDHRQAGGACRYNQGKFSHIIAPKTKNRNKATMNSRANRSCIKPWTILF